MAHYNSLTTNAHTHGQKWTFTTTPESILHASTRNPIAVHYELGFREFPARIWLAKLFEVAIWCVPLSRTLFRLTEAASRHNAPGFGMFVIWLVHDNFPNSTSNLCDTTVHARTMRSSGITRSCARIYTSEPHNGIYRLGCSNKQHLEGAEWCIFHFRLSAQE